ncbi:hypothetical protein V7S43_018428 [Phytophthora oleae]|uniref:Uncharacterized protein n=1 Tax=Phytophthora oleae TaxID=2107226 RepID=A0ABD3EU76_9STRA
MTLERSFPNFPIGSETDLCIGIDRCLQGNLLRRRSSPVSLLLDSFLLTSRSASSTTQPTRCRSLVAYRAVVTVKLLLEMPAPRLVTLLPVTATRTQPPLTASGGLELEH